ncbi:IS66 family insertion sequence element accessory protein TnpB [Chitinophaga silvisoli]|uniref:Transposase n=1 Tax=Chitinophaga silvisoli TaxID=2291814 RepID=A0A3E1NMQ1_9BACT|nr:IS66 family insertion sequence element accessory protein TnpB [Chitinophaga silvisoli]RFM29210.1 transposase [Chitinophaga silvisoli]
MLQIHPGTRYLLYSKWADVRKSFDGLSGLITNELKMPIESGDVFIFLNRRQTHIKLLQWEGDGFGMYYKRLEEGTFDLPSGFMEGTHSEISSKQLSLVLQGVSLKKAFYRKRYTAPED